MRKVAIPIKLSTLQQDFPKAIASFKETGVDRVFICGVGNAYLETCTAYTETEFMKYAIDTLKAEGFEVGVWIGGFGHGVILQHERDAVSPDMFTPLEGINGETTKHGFCPYDDKFIEAFAAGVKAIAELNPALIMIDDDFRISLRANFYFGCFCEKHLKEFYRRLGEEVPRDKIEELIYTGGKNKYRDTYRGLMRDTILDFAKRMRAEVDSVNPEIRLTSCTSCENWDANGFTMIELAKAFAGNTKPYTRVCGAPYGDWAIIPEIDTTRLQMKWHRDAGVETMSEGDVYPRPRYNVPSKVLELFDFMLIANNTEDGILAYMYDYSQKPEYETGYTKRYIKNEGLREELCEIFGDKKPTGIELFQVPKLFEKADLPEKLVDNIFHRMCYANAAASTLMLSRNSIPTCFEGSDYPLYIVGEHAKYVDLELLKRGAILDVAVDIRKGSPTYMKWVAVELSAENKKMLYIPKGCLHGFVTLTDDVEIAYKVDEFYSPENDRSIRFDDAEIGVEWGIENPVLSKKDENAPLLCDSDVDFIY